MFTNFTAQRLVVQILGGFTFGALVGAMYATSYLMR